MGNARVVSAAALAWGVALGACGARTELEIGGGAGVGGSVSSPWVVDIFRQTAVTKVDLLLTIDNSISMADKQAILAEAVPSLVQRLITAGSALDPISDVHVGVITSSLGSHGANGARDVCVSAEDDDHAHLLGQLRGLAGTWRNAGFLVWDPMGQNTPPGDADSAVFSDKLRGHVQSAGEHGCGYEATLEAWYRFLIDPEPPSSIVLNGVSAERQGIDQAILEQRAAFLRPDSLVGIIMLSDENDCSLVDEGFGWLVAHEARLTRSTSACAENPNDACCQSCTATRVPGCPDPKTDRQCLQGELSSAEDDLNLRCWQQKRRFGFDLLYPTSRYSDALRSPLVTSSSAGRALPNPLFVAPAGFLPRDRTLVYLAGIIGVPWQDIADEQSLTGPGLRYLTAGQLADEGRWDVILGDPTADPPIPPADPFMLETPQDRTQLAVSQQNPIAPEQKLVGAESSDPRANAINGHEQRDVGGQDLQYACTFPLDTPRTCDQAVFDSDSGCDCFTEDQVFNRGLCQPPGGGPAGIVQQYAKAYPGLRHLQVLKEVGDSGIVASICPKVLDKKSSDYGYNPAVDALITRMTDNVFRRCLQHPLPLSAEGRVPCRVVQVFAPTATGCACDVLGMSSLGSADATLAQAVQNKLLESSQCGGSDPKCKALCRCELPQLEATDLEACQNSPASGSRSGFCYISATQGEPNVGNAALVADCARPSLRDLRIVGGAPPSQVLTLLACPSGG